MCALVALKLPCGSFRVNPRVCLLCPCTQVLREASGMVDESDLQLSHLALMLCTAVIKKHPRAAELLREHVLPRAFALASSPLLQADALASLQLFFKELLALHAPGLDFNFLMTSIMSLRQGGSKATVSSPGDAPADMSTYGTFPPLSRRGGVVASQTYPCRQAICVQHRTHRGRPVRERI